MCTFLYMCSSSINGLNEGADIILPSVYLLGQIFPKLILKIVFLANLVLLKVHRSLRTGKDSS